MNLRGRLFYRGEILEAGIKVENGIVVKIGKAIDGKKVKGVILPAAIDVHVHFRDFKERHKETIESGSLSALYGGVCLAIDQPNTLPRIEDEKTYIERVEKAKKTSYIDYALNLGLTTRNAEKIDERIRKIEESYWIPAIGEVFLKHSDKNMQIDYRTLGEVRKIVKKPITLHAEDPNLTQEIEAVRRCIELGRFHFCHISTFDALKLIKNTDLTLEVTPHHLLLSIEDKRRLGRLFNVNPPLREKANADALLNSIGLADVIASDHAPHPLEDKLNGAPGFPGVETMYPLLMFLVKKGVVGLKTIVERIATNPARILFLSRYGEIEVGNYANFALFDFSDIRRIKAEKLHSKAEWTPYEGFEAIFPYKVFIRGVEALDDRVLIEPGFGIVGSKKR